MHEKTAIPHTLNDLENPISFACVSFMFSVFRVPYWLQISPGTCYISFYEI